VPKGLQTRWIGLLCGDLVAILLVPYLGAVIAGAAGASLSVSRFGLMNAIVTGSWLAALYFEDLYAIDVPRPKSNIVVRLAGAGSVVVLLLVLVTLFTTTLNVHLTSVIFYAVVTSMALAAWRLDLSYTALHGVVIVGTGQCAIDIAKSVKAHRHLGYRFLGFVECCPAAQQRAVRMENAPFLSMPPIEQFPHRELVNIVVVACDAKDAISPRQLFSWRLEGKSVVDCDTFAENLTGRVVVSTVQDSWLAFSPGFRRSSWALRLSRLIDLVGASLILVTALPIYIMSALAIKLESAGPLLYSQERLGKDGKPFRLHKLRSMRDGAERDTGPVWAQVRDPRVTRTGRVLRRSRIDELPQLLNVLKGDMSLVGPRPERTELVDQLARAIPLYKSRLSVKPGITGWAQICYPYGASIEDAQEKLCYDLYYIKNWSLALDLQILLQSVKVVVFGRGAR
jgi:exopolysaccharide biosynthesis polyprenyl glycosylphosphotransferase